MTTRPPRPSVDETSTDGARTRHLGTSRGKTAARAPQGRQWVAVIGIDDYLHWPKLFNAVTDASGVQGLFTQKLGFATARPPLLNADATAAAITGLVRDDLPAMLAPDDSLVLFFAGHGHTRSSRVGSQTVDSG